MTAHDHLHRAGPRQAKVLTVSDGVMAGTGQDRSGQALVERCSPSGFEVVEPR